jgi:hypothetical protein
MDQWFPNLTREGYVETSPASLEYNCIAWAAGDEARWWWPDANFTAFWPPDVPRAETMSAFTEAFETLGYELCENRDLEPDFVKIALYAKDGKPTHAARQLPDGQWTSKLGDYIDITHTLRGLEGPIYGGVAVFMKRHVMGDSTASGA